MDAPFQALDMFPDSMHRLMSYEHILNGALVSDSKNQEVNMDQDDMDTCGFPLYFSHGLQDDGGLPSFAKGMVAADTSSMDKVNCSYTIFLPLVKNFEMKCPQFREFRSPQHKYSWENRPFDP